MDDKPLYREVCIGFIIVFALILICSIGGIFYGIAKEYYGYMWAGITVAIISLGVEILASYGLYKNERKKLPIKRGNRENEGKNYQKGKMAKSKF